MTQPVPNIKPERQFPHPYGDVNPPTALPPHLASVTVRAVEAIDVAGLDRDGRTRALAGVIAEHAQRFSNRTEAVARLVEIATQLAMGNGR